MKTIARAAATLAAIILATVPAIADEVRVVDGDTIQKDGVTYRLWGIDAPESHQLCNGVPAGGIATEALRNLARGKEVQCEDRVKDRYGRTVALCRANGEDLGATMVQSGWAFAFVRYSRDYVAIEEKARAENIGVHAMRCEFPWEWRSRSRGDK